MIFLTKFSEQIKRSFWGPHLLEGHCNLLNIQKTSKYGKSMRKAKVFNNNKKKEAKDKKHDEWKHD